LFCLKTGLEIYRFTQNKIQDCDKCVERQLAAFEIRTALPNATGNLRMQLHQICGVDLTKIPGIKEQSAQIIISDLGGTAASQSVRLASQSTAFGHSSF